MQLELEEITIGLVVFLDSEMIATDPRITRSLREGFDPDDKQRPLVCVSIEEGLSLWTPLTSQGRRERLRIPSYWRSGGSLHWRTRCVYVQDAARLYLGPHAAFVDASHVELTDRTERMVICEAGVREICVAIEQQQPRARWFRTETLLHDESPHCKKCLTRG